jgi:hypothetical protein
MVHAYVVTSLTCRGEVVVTRAGSAGVREGAPRDAAQLRVGRRWEWGGREVRRWHVKREVATRRGGGQSEGGAAVARYMHGQARGGRWGTDRAGKRDGVIRGSIRRVAAGSLSEASTVEAVATG